MRASLRNQLGLVDVAVGLSSIKDEDDRAEAADAFGLLDSDHFLALIETPHPDSPDHLLSLLRFLEVNCERRDRVIAQTRLARPLVNKIDSDCSIFDAVSEGKITEAERDVIFMAFVRKWPDDDTPIEWSADLVDFKEACNGR